MGIDRRTRRKMARDILKDIKGTGKKFNVPTEKEIKNYIENKSKENIAYIKDGRIIYNNIGETITKEENNEQQIS